MQIFKIWLKGIFLILFIIVCPFGTNNNNIAPDICQSKIKQSTAIIKDKEPQLIVDDSKDDDVIDEKENFDYEPSPFIQREIKQQTVKPATVTNSQSEINYEKAEKQRLKRLKQAEKQLAKIEKKEEKQKRKEEKQAKKQAEKELKAEQKAQKQALKEEQKEEKTLEKELKRQERRNKKNKDDD